MGKKCHKRKRTIYSTSSGNDGNPGINKTEYMGTYMHYANPKTKALKRYRAQIFIHTGKGRAKPKHLGTHDTPLLAAIAYDREAIKQRVPLSKLNFPNKAPVGYTPKRRQLQIKNKVGYRGVCKTNNKFMARSIMFEGVQTSLGTYDTAKEAAIAFDRAVLKSNRSTTFREQDYRPVLNFPDMVHNLDVEPIRKKRKYRLGYRGLGKGVTKANLAESQLLLGLVVPMIQKKVKKPKKQSKKQQKKIKKKKQTKKKQSKKKQTKKKKEVALAAPKVVGVTLKLEEYREMLQASM